MLPSERYWPLPELDRVEIEYTVSDLWANDDGDPDEQHVQRITGEITGVFYGDDGRKAVPLGSLALARIDLDRLDEEAASLLGVRDTFDEPALRDGLRYLLVADRLELRREARGRGLGLHALARALRTWATDDTLVVLTAASIQVGREASCTPARYWAKLGFERLPGSTQPVPALYARGDWPIFADALRRYSAWESPLTASVAR